MFEDAFFGTDFTCDTAGTHNPGIDMLNLPGEVLDFSAYGTEFSGFSDGIPAADGLHEAWGDTFGMHYPQTAGDFSNFSFCGNDDLAEKAGKLNDAATDYAKAKNKVEILADRAETQIRQSGEVKPYTQTDLDYAVKDLERCDDALAHAQTEFKIAKS